MGNAIYGKGSWAHYLLSYKNYLGNPGLYILMIGIPAMMVLAFQKRWKQLELEWWFYAYGIFFGVVISHSYFYATGQNGSYGLTRIATQGMPIFLLLHLHYIGQFQVFQKKVFSGLFAVFSAGLIFALITTKYYPKTADPLDLAVIQSAEFVRSLELQNQQIFYYAPLFCYMLGENNFKPNSRMQFFTFSNLEENLQMHFKAGDLLVRDSHFGPLEMNLQLADLAKHEELVLIKEYISSEQIDDPLGEMEGVKIYEYRPK